jgi:hypothetical protein
MRSVQAAVVWLAVVVSPAAAFQIYIDGRVPETRSADPTLMPAPSVIDFTIGADVAAATAEARIRALGQPQRISVGQPVASHYRRPADGVSAPAWAVDIATINPWGVWRVFVSGVDGSVIKVTDLTRKVRGLVFPTVKSVKRKQPEMRTIRDLVDSHTLISRSVHVDDLTDFLALCPTDQLFCNPPRATTCAANRHAGGFVYPSHANGTFETCTGFDRFDQVTGYFQLSKMSDYFAGRLGWRLGSGILATDVPLPVLANVPLFANAFFAPPTTAAQAFFAFGDEFAPPTQLDFLRDPTVPRHEFTHSVIWDLDTALNDDFTCVGGCSALIGALNEALADYFAIASFGARTTVVGSRLGTSLTDAARDLKNDFRFPCDLTGEPHSDGRIWAGFLLEVRRLFGGSADSAIFRSLPLLPHAPASLQFGDALVALLQTLAPDPRHLVRIVESAVRHGLISPSSFDRGDQTQVVVSNGDAAWTCANDASCSADPVSRVEGTASARMDVLASFGTGLVAHETLDAPADLRGDPLLELAVKDSLGAGPGELQIVLDDDPDCTTPIVTLPLPPIPVGIFQQVTLPIPAARELLGNIQCVGLVIASSRGGRTTWLDDIVGVLGTKFGPLVVAIDAGRKLSLHNRFPAPLGDAHFYYFRPPAGTTRVTVVASASHKTDVNQDLHYCGNVSVSGSGVLPELNNAFLWLYDPSQPVLQYNLTPLPIDQHLLVSGVPTHGPRSRVLRRYPLPASPTGIYAVSLQGSGRYRVKLAFE